MQEKWIINRIGLVNFWYYDEEEFRFCNGRLLLRGANGSGKSVTMQSFIPLLLDANKSPERLDPFGSRARKLENYLLGEEDQGEEERTGYLYMEFVKKESGKFLTVGLGLQARRGKSLNSWGFAITDNRRIGRDFFLYKKIGEKVPLSKRELKNRLAEGGEFHDGPREYMVMVNKLLYGFENLEDYDQLIKLLVQLRTPKLSKDFKPTVIYDIMNNALQTLSDEDLRPMSEAIENMDNIKTQLEALKESKKAADKLKNEYDRYNRFLLLEKAKNLLKAGKNLAERQKELALQEKALRENQLGYQQAQERLTGLKSSEKRLKHKKQELEKHDSFKAKQEIEQREQQLSELDRHRLEKQQNSDGKKNRENQLRYQLKEQQQEYEQLEKKTGLLLGDMSEKADDFHFHEDAFAQDEIRTSPHRKYDFSYWKNELSSYQNKLTRGKRLLEDEQKQRRDYDHALQELDEARQEKDEATRELDRVRLLFDQTCEELVEKVYHWRKGNRLLRLPEETMVALTRLIRAYGQEVGYDDIIAEVRKEVSASESVIHQELAALRSAREGHLEELGDKEAEVAEWRKKKDPEPVREQKVILNRERLERAGIPFLPLYKAVDFIDGLSLKERGVLEEALLDMGLLDALIVPVKYREQVARMEEGMADKYIFPAPQLISGELSQLLKAEEPGDRRITTADIDQVLKSIVLSKKGSLTYLNQKGQFGIGLLKGQASCTYTAKYIGAQARESYRQAVIKQLEAEVAAIKGEIARQLLAIKEREEQLLLIKKELAAFPAKTDLETAWSLLYTVNLDLENKQKEADKKETAAEKSYAQLKEISEQVREATAKIYIALNLASYQQALEDAAEYKDMLGKLETDHTLMVEKHFQINGLNEQIAEVLQDIDNLLVDMHRIEGTIKENRAIIQNYREQLAKTNYQEIKKEIDDCLLALNEIPQQIQDEAMRSGDCHRQCQTISEQLLGLKGEVSIAQKAFTAYREGFEREYRLGYVVVLEGEQEGTAIAREIVRRFKSEESANKSKEDYGTMLIDKFHLNRQYLVEYNLTLEHLFTEENTTERLDETIKRIYNSFKRIELRAKIKGRDVNFNTLVDFINEAIDENERLLQERDRQLFEEILANTISKKIRARIYHAEQWVQKMNSLMESMNTSSGLSLSLRWKSRVAEKEGQLDTRQLVQILKSEASLLREEDFRKLSSHFRSKISEVRKIMEDSGTSQTFHSIMKDILDYRKWFEFGLFYQKTNERKRELTNNAFNKFSGGEKAMAMYIPLFSAVYARYEGARRDCPRIISLDEAFAGVDENNIRDIFRLLEELRLNYIINSQILWGDYDTVPSLSICELVRPNNANVVTVIRYQWDGKIRKLVS